MTIFGDGNQTRAFSYIGDIVPVMVDALQTKGTYNEVFNIGADQPYSVNELAESIAVAMGVAPDIVHLPPRNEVIDAYSSHEKLVKFFGHRTLHSLDEGLGLMAEWVWQHGARESQPFEDIEILKNFPEAWKLTSDH
jgi:UDP-glucose 4-epimerase